MEIYFLRHANAGEQKLNPAKDDLRPLDKLGIEQSHIVGRTLAALNLKLDAIISSPLVRAHQTASIVADEIGYQEAIITNDALRHDSTYEQFEQLLAHYGDKEAILMVGHRPSQTEFLNRLVAGGDTGPIDFKKGAIARVDKEGSKPAVLKWLMPPKLVRAIQQASAKSSRPKTVSK